MFGKRRPQELAIPPAAYEADQAGEVLRAWVVDGKQHVSLIPAFDDPGSWGIFLVDLARHAARAYAAEGVTTEAEALRRIYALWAAEVGSPTDLGSTERLSDQH